MERNLRNDKRGIASQIMIVIIMGIVLAMLMLFIFIGQLIGPPLISTLQDTNGILQETMQSTNNENLTSAAQASFQPAADSLNNFEWLSYTLIIMVFLVFIVMCFYVRTYPFLLFVWIIMIILLVVMAIYLSVVYQDLATDNTLGGYYTSWENTDFILQNLPAIILILGIVGGIVMFILSSREQEAEIGGGYL